MSKLFGALQIKQAEKCEPACEKKKDQGASVTQQVIGNDGTYRALAKLLKQEKMFEKKGSEDDNEYPSTIYNGLKGLIGGGVVGYGLSGEKDKLKNTLRMGGLGAGIGGSLGYMQDRINQPSEEPKFSSPALELKPDPMDEAKDFYRHLNSAPVSNPLSKEELNALYMHRATQSPIPPEMQQKLAPFIMKR